jgi:hypothetical protein
MEGAESNLPVRPLVGSTLLASAQIAAGDQAGDGQTDGDRTGTNPAGGTQPSVQTAVAKPPEADKPDALERILNGIFGGT